MSRTARRDLKGRRAVAAAAAVLAAGAVYPGQAASAEEAQDAAAECVMTTLPIPEGTSFTFTTAASDDGSIVAYRTYPADPNSDFARPLRLYQDGEVTDIPVPGADQSVGGVNSEGTAVGFSFIDGVQIPFVWTEGKLEKLDAGEGGGDARDVNEAGDIVGSRGDYPSVPVLWPAGESEPVDLPLPKGALSGTATSIDEDGTIVGYYEDALNGNFRPYVWDADGEGAALPMPDGIEPGTAHSYPKEIDEGWVVGYLRAPETDGSVGILWNLDEGTAETVKLDTTGSVNPDGWVSGSVDPYAAVVTDSDRFKLPGAVDPDDNWFGDQGTSISDDGTQVAGNVFAGENEYGHVLNAVVWNCR